jgi:hypothetical protein
MKARKKMKNRKAKMLHCKIRPRHTVSAGVNISLFEKRLKLSWNMEYSWAADGEFMSVLSVNYFFD